MSEHDLFNKKLIEEVKKYEFIYNLAHPDRRRGTTSQEKWSEIASAVEGTVKKCRYRWNSLRRRYISEYSKMLLDKDGEKYESDWKYMDAMSFLEGYVGQNENFLESLSKLSKRDVFCRACLRPFTNNTELSSDSYNIFGTENFAEKLMQCTNLEIVPWDEYPHSLCRNCYEKVLDFCRFQDMCRESLEKFIVITENQTDVKSQQYEEEINDSFLESVIEYTDIDCVSIQEQSVEKHTAPVDHVEHCNDNTEHGNRKEYVNDTMEIGTDEVDPLEGRTDTELFSEEEQECRKGFKTNTSLNGDIANKETDTTDAKNQLEFTFNDNDDTIQIELIEEEEDESAIEIAKDVDENLDFHSDDENSVSDESEASGEKEKTSSRVPLKCDKCPQAFIYPHRLEAHKRRHRGLSGYPCSFENCSRAYNRLSDLRNHLNDHNGIPNVYKCDIDNCNMVYSRYSLLNKHKRRVHKCGRELRTYTCEICGKGLTSLRSLKGHRFIHVDKSQWPYGCDEKDCTVRFRFLAQKKIHLKRHAGIKDFICPHCGMRKTTSTELKIHINFHTFEQKYPCRICSKVFKSVGTMGTHIRMVHEGKQKKAIEATNGAMFQCSYCDRKLSSAQTKKYHEMNHTGEQKPCVCDKCGKTFTRPSHLKQHQLMHVNGEKPYACEECGVRYKWPSHLQTHMKVHLEGANPYPCEICGKRFKWPGNLKSHMLLHTEGLTPYTCEECGKGFKWPGSFYNHKKAHMKQKTESTPEVEDVTDEHLDP